MDSLSPAEQVREGLSCLAVIALMGVLTFTVGHWWAL